MKKAVLVTLTVLSRLLLGIAVSIAAIVGGWTVYQNRLADQSEIYADHTADALGQFAGLGVGSGAEADAIHYQRFGNLKNDGNSVPVLFIHGYNQNAGSEWLVLAQRLALSTGRVTIVPDMLGFGFSSRSRDPQRYSLKGQAQNLVVLMDALGIKQADVVGVSWGGAVAAQMALDHPTRMRRLVLFNAQIAGSGYDFIARSGALPIGIGRAISWYAIGDGEGGKNFFVSGCQAQDYCPTQAEIDRRIRHTLIAGTTDAMNASSAAPTDPVNKRIPQDLNQLTAPTVVLHSRNDEFIPFEAVRATVARMPAGTRFVPMDFMSHVPHLRVPDEVEPLLIDALK